MIEFEIRLSTLETMYSELTSKFNLSKKESKELSESLNGLFEQTIEKWQLFGCPNVWIYPDGHLRLDNKRFFFTSFKINVNAGIVTIVEFREMNEEIYWLEVVAAKGNNNIPSC